MDQVPAFLIWALLACRIHLESGAEAAVCMLWRGMHCLRSISDLEFCVCPYLLVYFVVRGYVHT